MIKSLVILFLLFFGYSFTQAQEVFIDRPQKRIMDSLFKINYRRFNGQVTPDRNYIMGFQYDVLQDSAYMKKIQSSGMGIVPLQDTIHTKNYSFLFDTYGICISSTIFYNNLNDYQTVIEELDSHYQNTYKEKIWIDSSRQIEVIVTKNKLTRSFEVYYHKVKK